VHDHSLPMLTKSARSESCRYHLAPCDNQLVGTESRPERGCMFVATSRAYWALVYRNAASAQSSSRASCSHLFEPPTFRRAILANCTLRFLFHKLNCPCFNGEHGPPQYHLHKFAAIPVHCRSAMLLPIAAATESMLHDTRQRAGLACCHPPGRPH
jgi:hypothetical protein